MDRDELLDQSVEYFKKTFSKNGKLKINDEILYRIKQLQNRLEMEESEIFQAVFQYFIEKKLYEKYQAEKALSTFITYCVKYGLCDVGKKGWRKHSKKECSLESILGDKLCGSGASSFSVDEANGFPDLVEYNTPEDLLIGKELRELIFAYFGPTDALVCLGYEDLQKTASSLGMSYDAYRKRLLRKKEQFKAFLEKRGYQLH